MDINLYGVCVLDTIFQKNEIGTISLKEEKFGGIFNVARALSSNHNITCFICIGNDAIDRDFGFATVKQLSGRPTSTSNIIINNQDYEIHLNSSACQDFQLLNACAEWHHIAYLNALPKITREQIRALNGIVSIDLCRENFVQNEVYRIKDLCKEADFVFMNRNEANQLFDNSICSNIAKRATIIHAKDSVHLITNSNNQLFTYIPEDKINSLGCGDYFCAGFINQYSIDESLIDAVGIAYNHAKNLGLQQIYEK